MTTFQRSAAPRPLIVSSLQQNLSEVAGSELFDSARFLAALAIGVELEHIEIRGGRSYLHLRPSQGCGEGYGGCSTGR